tara:strand:+ start:258 stop:698 length:441 start_codon:yes stop_codon:yes gene_type:complete
MKFIAHRGNTQGKNLDQENKIDYLRYASSQGHGVEFDVQCYNDTLYLGHDEPQEKLSLELLRLPHAFIHAKDIESLEKLLKLNCNVFWHQSDKLTVTNLGFIWCYPGVFVNSTQAVWLDLHDFKLPNTISNIYGICGDKINEKHFA